MSAHISEEGRTSGKAIRLTASRPNETNEALESCAEAKLQTASPRPHAQ